MRRPTWTRSGCRTTTCSRPASTAAFATLRCSSPSSLHDRAAWPAPRPPGTIVTVMKIGVSNEVKNHEYRVAITPIGVYELVAHGHELFIEKSAGVGSSIDDQEYVGAGAKIVD